MTIKYVAIKDTKNGSDVDACAFNCSIFAEGVKGIECTEARDTTYGEKLDYTQYIPWGCHFSCVEIYANGAKNFFVRNIDEKNVSHIVGYLLVRPLY